MLTSTALTYSAGKIVNVEAAPTAFLSNVGFVSGQLATSVGAVAFVVDGLPRASDGAIAVEEAAVAYWQNGLPLTASGKLAVDSASAVAYYHMGLPFAADGRLCITVGGGGSTFYILTRGGDTLATRSADQITYR